MIVRDLCPLAHVADVRTSIEFYELLGFEVRATHMNDGELDWATIGSDRAKLMLARASAPVIPDQQATLFYLYSEDLAALRDRVRDAGIAAGEIRDGTPGPRREMRLSDPDGYCLMVAQIE
jgi:predicted enzyme related to lactoylglutathione lyase